MGLAGERSKRNGTFGDDGGDGVFVNDLLRFVAHEDDDVLVISDDGAVHLETIHKKNGDVGLALAQPGKEYVFWVDRFVHGNNYSFGLIKIKLDQKPNALRVSLLSLTLS